jgi:predicted ATP-dependent endonuclease of OLD family
MIIGLQVRHFKAYKNIKYIPIGHEHNFVAYSGENGAGKSSILEALDTFLNNKMWLLTKNTNATDSYICPLFLIPKGKAPRLTGNFETISNYFWDLEQKDKRDQFFEVRDKIIESHRDTHYLIFAGETIEHKILFPFGESVQKSLLKELEPNFSEKNFLKELKDIYSYVYIPVEINSEDFTKIETVEMQKIFNKEVVNEIKKSLRPKDIENINTRLDSFVNELEGKMEGNYYYDTGDTGTKKLTQTSLVDTILEMYFKKRVLMKGSRDKVKLSKKMSELSAGEKRESLINLVYVFLKEEKERDRIIVIGIDEPENSLHTAICYEQFEKLKKVSKFAQVLLTTHWYGFLPIVDKGLVHFIKTEIREKDSGSDEIVVFDQTVDLYRYPYQTKKLPKDFSLKSTNDLVQSIFHSLTTNNPYNWLICEGSSDQIYLDYFLRDLKEELNLQIIPVGGVELVKKFHTYLSLPIKEIVGTKNSGRVFCLTDTDANLRKNGVLQYKELKPHIILKRLSVGDNNVTELINFEVEERQQPIDIEKSLNPEVFIETLIQLKVDDKYLIDKDDIQNIKGNTTTHNLRHWEIENLFSDEKIKDDFALKYISVMAENFNDENTPTWVKEVIDFFRK